MDDLARQKKKTMPVVFFHKAVETDFGKKKRYEKNEIAVIPVANFPKEELQGLVDQKVISIYPIDDLFQRYTIRERSRMLFTHLGGGIGDMIAFSSITAFLNQMKIKVFVDPIFKPVFDWFEYKPVVMNFDDVITKSDVSGRHKMNRRIAMEYAAIEGHTKNWYDAMYERIGVVNFMYDEFRAPRLVHKRINNHKSHIPKKDSVLIQHRASCQMRSSRFEDFYYPVKACFPDKNIYVHQRDLTYEDAEFIKGKDVYIIPKGVMADYLLNLYDAEWVVCTDTAAIHFREGVGKKCLGVFGAMTVESRTAAYVYTSSFNVESDCQYQPCFVHELVKGQVCLAHKKGDTVASCQTGIRFQKQLEEKLNTYIHAK